MNTCIQCIHWQPKAGNAALARMGFAQCIKKAKGHTTSAEARACEKFNPLDAGKVAARRAWLEKTK